MTTSDETNLALLQRDIAYIKDEMNKLTSNYASNARVDNLDRRIALLEKAIFGVIGLIVFAVIGAVINGALK